MYVALLLLSLCIYIYTPHFRQLCQQHGNISSSRATCWPRQPRCELYFAWEKCLLCGMKSFVSFFIFARPCSESVVMPGPLARVCGLCCRWPYVLIVDPFKDSILCDTWYSGQLWSWPPPLSAYLANENCMSLYSVRWGLPCHAPMPVFKKLAKFCEIFKFLNISGLIETLVNFLMAY